MRRIATSWKLIESVLQENAHSAYQGLRPPANPELIRGLGELIGVKLPRSFLSSLRVHDGMHGDANFAGSYSLLPVAGMEKYWRITMDCPWDVVGPRVTDGRRIKGDIRWRRGWVPIAVDAAGNFLAMDLDPGPAGTQSQVFRWQNYGSPPPKVVASSYPGWLDGIAEELAHRRFDLDPRGGIHLRKRLA